MFEEVKKVLWKWGLQVAPEKIRKGDSVNYLGYRIGLQRIRTQRAQIRRDWCGPWMVLRLLGDISSLQLIVGITPDLIIH